MSSTQDSQGVPGIPPNIALLTGPQLLGLFFNWGLLGSLCNQVYIYSLCFPRDSKYVKLLVYSLFLAEIAQTCMATSDAFNWLVYGWGRPDQLGNYQLSWLDVPILTGIISATVQVSFAWRIWVLSRSWILGGIIVMISLVQGSAAIATGIQIRLLPGFAELPSLFPTVSVWLGGSALVDILIAVSMTYLLSRSRNGFHETNYLLARLVRLTVETGTVTATVATVDLLLFNLFKDNNLHICPATTLAKLYTNSLMVVFNNRVFIRAVNPLSTSGATSGHVELEPADFYRARIRDVMSQNSARMAGGAFFSDEGSREVEAVRDIPLDSISAHNASSMEEGSKKYLDQWSG